MQVGGGELSPQTPRLTCQKSWRRRLQDNRILEDSNGSEGLKKEYCPFAHIREIDYGNRPQQHYNICCLAQK
jgi:hypothetical protein